MLVRPCLHTPVDIPALQSAYAQYLTGGGGGPELAEVLLPRPPGRSLRVPLELPVGWTDTPSVGTPRRAGT